MVNIVAGLVLSRSFSYVGIAMGSTIAAWLNAAVLGVTLARRGHFEMDARLKRRLPRTIVSGLLMGVILLLGAWLLGANFAEKAGFLNALWSLTVLILGGIASYFALAHVTGAMTLSELKSVRKQ